MWLGVSLHVDQDRFDSEQPLRPVDLPTLGGRARHRSAPRFDALTALRSRSKISRHVFPSRDLDLAVMGIASYSSSFPHAKQSPSQLQLNGCFTLLHHASTRGSITKRGSTGRKNQGENMSVSVEVS